METRRQEYNTRMIGESSARIRKIIGLSFLGDIGFPQDMNNGMSFAYSICNLRKVYSADIFDFFLAFEKII